MTCYNPILGYRQLDKNKNGKRPLTFSKSEGIKHTEMELPCGKCIGCKLEYSRQWAVRCVHESMMHEYNSFLTLTYRPENEPQDKSVTKREMQLFIKKLRKATGKKLRYFLAGEYGEKGWKPHYHLIIFGYNFPDKEYWGQSPAGSRLYVSPQLSKIWDKGYHSIGEVTVQSAAYTARYCMKKQQIAANEDGTIPLVDKDTGELHILQPEFILMSRRPGLGKGWYEKYKTDAFPKDFITIDGSKNSIPKYYDTLYELENPAEMQQIKEKRAEFAIKKGDKTLARKYVKETVKKAQINSLKRPLEE